MQIYHQQSPDYHQRDIEASLPKSHSGTTNKTSTLSSKVLGRKNLLLALKTISLQLLGWNFCAHIYTLSEEMHLDLYLLFTLSILEDVVWFLQLSSFVAVLFVVFPEPSFFRTLIIFLGVFIAKAVLIIDLLSQIISGARFVS